MAVDKGETIVGIDMTDYGSLVGIMPPLTKDEINTLEWGGVINKDNVTRVDELELSFTAISIENEPTMLLDEKIKIAQEKADLIVLALEGIRKGHIRQSKEPAFLVSSQTLPPNQQAGTSSLEHTLGITQPECTPPPLITKDEVELTKMIRRALGGGDGGIRVKSSTSRNESYHRHHKRK